MTALAPYLSSFLREHLPKERRASQHTCEAYAQSFQLLLGFAASRLKIKPSRIEIERLDAPLVLAFLEHLEKKRGNSARTRNARLAAINSFFRFLEYRVPSCLDQSRRIHAIPMKKTAAAVKAWLNVRPASTALELFLNARAQAMTRSGFEYILAKHAITASRTAPTIAGKGVSPHVLRHTCAMHTLRATRDVRKVSLWLGHASLQSTEVYLRADPTEKLEALAAMAPPMLKPGRFRAPDKLMAMLNTTGRKPNYAE